MDIKTSDLLDFYYDELYNELTSLESERKRILKQLYVVAAVVAGVAAAYFFATKGDPVEKILTLLPIGFAIVALSARWFGHSYRNRFKRDVFRRLVTHIDPSLTYDPDGKVHEGLFVASGLFETDYDRYEGKDYIRGKIGKTPIEFSNLKVEKRSRDARGREHRETIFNGTFIVTEFHKHFTRSLMVLPDVAERYMGVLGGWFQNIGSKNLVRMDSPEFENYFKVYCDDPVEAHYLLTPNLMEKIVALRKEAGSDLYFSFRYDKLFIAIANGGKWFEPTLFRSLLRLDVFKSYIDNLDLILSIVEELNLNRRIWSKA
ncbi:DUF3137 domain-containing protein [Hydrogenimonas urashimensis]|uniref:DUF3137 domain-containing protein n=1 Tax=Hydrogenimonas urashimensis TaxID=2740515 RepID=UPI001915F55B|nr:DUF3137 domain-containing protein [Hydrogenimonas urashimensis]